jgi:hypothetical protein
MIQSISVDFNCCSLLYLIWYFGLFSLIILADDIISNEESQQYNQEEGNDVPKGFDQCESSK